MSVTVVLDGAGLHAWAERRPPRQVLAVMEVLRRAGAGRVLVRSVVVVEALKGDAHDAAVDQVFKQIDVQEHLPLAHARAEAALRQGTDGSAVDAVVAEAASRTRAAYVITSDADDLQALPDRPRRGANGGRDRLTLRCREVTRSCDVAAPRRPRVGTVGAAVQDLRAMSLQRLGRQRDDTDREAVLGPKDPGQDPKPRHQPHR